MAGELSQESVLDFLKQRGGKVTNAELLERFSGALSAEEPLQRAAVRRDFKSYVDKVAVVKTVRGVKHVCVKKKFRGSSSGSSGAESPESLAPEADLSRQVSRDDAASPGSGSGNDRETVPRCFAAESVLAAQTERTRALLEFVRLSEEEEEEEEGGGSGGMGNRGSIRRLSRSVKERQETAELPRITVSEAVPLPEEEVFDLPGPEPPGLSPTQKHAESPVSPRDDESHLSESEGSVTPTHSRRRFIRAMISSSPEVRRSIHLSSRHSSDSLASSPAPEDDRTSVTLDPAEHEWMMCASDGEWASLHRLLAAEPGLVQKKDFVTGFTCLHWAAKHGKPELMAQILHFAERHGVPVGVDVRSNMGYTPLHVAAMHGHMEVVKLLVGAFNADVELRDHSGRKACQYLADNASVDIQDITGAHKQPEFEDADHRGDEGRWKFSRVLQSNLKPLRLINNDLPQPEGRVREKPVRRRSSFNMMKPKVQKVRLRTSQIVHSSSFSETDNVDVSRKGSFKSRPHTHFFS